MSKPNWIVIFCDSKFYWEDEWGMETWSREVKHIVRPFSGNNLRNGGAIYALDQRSRLIRNRIQRIRYYHLQAPTAMLEVPKITFGTRCIWPSVQQVVTLNRWYQSTVAIKKQYVQWLACRIIIASAGFLVLYTRYYAIGVYAIALVSMCVCLFVCLSVYLTQAGVLSKWLHGSIWCLANGLVLTCLKLKIPEFPIPKKGYFLLPCPKL